MKQDELFVETTTDRVPSNGGSLSRTSGDAPRPEISITTHDPDAIRDLLSCPEGDERERLAEGH